MELEFQMNDPDLSDPIQGDERGYHVIRLNVFADVEVGDVQSPRLPPVKAPPGKNLVGYLRIAWIPKKEWDLKLPTVWHYRALFGGDSWIRHYLETGDRDWLYEHVMRTKPPASAVERDRQLKIEEKQRSKAYLDFKKYLVDRPYVDYIRVAPELARQGIGTELYQRGAKYLATLGLKLHASGNQTEAAKAAWAKMLERGFPVKQEGKRRVLDYTAKIVRRIAQAYLSKGSTSAR